MLTYNEAIKRSVDFLIVLRGYDSPTAEVPSVLSGVAAALATVYEKQTSEVGEELLQKVLDGTAESYLHEK